MSGFAVSALTEKYLWEQNENKCIFLGEEKRGGTGGVGGGAVDGRNSWIVIF